MLLAFLMYLQTRMILNSVVLSWMISRQYYVFFFIHLFQGSFFSTCMTFWYHVYHFHCWNLKSLIFLDFYLKRYILFLFFLFILISTTLFSLLVCFFLILVPFLFEVGVYFTLFLCKFVCEICWWLIWKHYSTTNIW